MLETKDRAGSTETAIADVPPATESTQPTSARTKMRDMMPTLSALALTFLVEASTHPAVHALTYGGGRPKHGE